MPSAGAAEIAAVQQIADQLTINIENSRLFNLIREKDRLAALGAMSAGLAHEIRNPLAAIKGAAQELDPKKLPDGIENEMIEIIGNQCQARIIEDVKSEIHNEGTPFAVICDETSDISRHEQFSLCISYIDKSGINKESFICFIKVHATDGASLFKVLSNVMNIWV